MLKKSQNRFKSDLTEIKTVKNKSNKQESTLYNIVMLYKARNSVIKFFNHYSSVISVAKYKIILEEETKTLTPKQVLQKQVMHLKIYRNMKVYSNIMK